MSKHHDLVSANFCGLLIDGHSFHHLSILSLDQWIINFLNTYLPIEKDTENAPFVYIHELLLIYMFNIYKAFLNMIQI